MTVGLIWQAKPLMQSKASSILTFDPEYVAPSQLMDKADQFSIEAEAEASYNLFPTFLIVECMSLHSEMTLRMALADSPCVASLRRICIFSKKHLCDNDDDSQRSSTHGPANDEVALTLARDSQPQQTPNKLKQCDSHHSGNQQANPRHPARHQRA